MIKAEIVKHLKRWEEIYLDLEQQQTALSKVIGCDYESPFMSAINAVLVEYTELVAEKVGDKIRDEYGYTWLTWYAYECQMGRKPMEAKRKEWRRAKKIDTIEKLAELISN